MVKTFSNSIDSETSLVISIIKNGPDYDDGYSISITTPKYPDGKSGILIKDNELQSIDLKMGIDDFIKSNKDQNYRLLFAKYLEDLAKILRKSVFKIV